MKKIVLLLVVMLLASYHVNSQISQKGPKTTVKGTILDDATGEKLIGAIVVIKGTTIGGISDSNGAFIVRNVDKGKEVIIEVSYVGYAQQTIKINTKEDTYQMKTPIRMKVDGVKIKDVTVMGSAPVAQLKGDTTVFNAGAYKINPDATAGDLLAKMPGFEKNDDGTVSSQGEKVQRVYVDGKSFFKNDLAAALNALPAGIVEGIEMFDDKSDKSKFTGFDDGNNVKSINIITKNRMGTKPTGLFEASVGYGYDNVYMGNLNFTRLSGDRQISIMAGANNINISPIQQRRGFGRWGGGGGINTQAGAAINFTNSLKNDGEIGVSYTYTRSDKKRLSYQNRTYFPSSDYTDYIYQSTDSSKNITNNHGFSLDLKTNLGDKTQLTFRPTGSISYGDNYSKSFNNSMMDGDTTRNNRINTSTPDSYSIGGDLSIMRKFTENSFISFGVNSRIQKSNSDSYLIGETIYGVLSQKEDSTQHQMSENISNTNNVGFDVEYTQRISRRSGISAGYEFGYNWSDNNKRTYIWDDTEGKYVDLDSTLSNNFQRNYMTNNTGLRYNYKTDLTSFNLSVKYQNAQMVNDRLFPLPTYNRDYSFDGAVINTEFRYKKSKEGGNFSVGYNGRPSYPSVTQLQDVMNNDNPLQLSSGNPNLKQSFNNSFELRYRGASIENSLFWSVFSSVSNTLNGVVNNTVLYKEDDIINLGGTKYQIMKGAQYTAPINMNGSWNARLGGMFSFPLEKIKTKINIMASYNFQNQPSMYNNVKYKSTTNGFGANIGFNSNISENIDFSINNSINYRVTKSNRVDDNNYFTDNLRVYFNWIIWKGFFVNADYNMNYQKLSNTPLDKPYTNMLNAAIGKKFSNDKFEIRASVYDALNQNVNIEQTVSDIYIAETIANNLTRYFSISFTYKFNSMKKNMNDMMRRGTGGGGHGGFGGRRTM